MFARSTEHTSRRPATAAGVTPYCCHFGSNAVSKLETTQTSRYKAYFSGVEIVGGRYAGKCAVVEVPKFALEFAILFPISQSDGRLRFLHQLHLPGLIF